jgi:hypothetical protein
MPNGFRTTINPFPLFQNVSNVSGARTIGYGGIDVDRQSRFQARSDRRWGNWSVLEVATPILWLGNQCEPLLPDELGEFISPVVELWP